MHEADTSDRPSAGVAVLSDGAAGGAVVPLLRDRLPVVEVATATDGASMAVTLADWRDADDVTVVAGVLGGLPGGRATVDAARSLVAETPAVALATGPGTTDPARDGTLPAGLTPRGIRDATLEAAGFVRVDALGGLVDAARALAGGPLPAGDRIAIVSNAGGPGVMAADAVAGSRLALARFGDETTAALRRTLPPGAAVHNPVDALATADLGAIRTALDAVLRDGAVAAALVVSAPSALFAFRDLAEHVAAARRDHDKPVAVALMGGSRTRAAAAVLDRAGVGTWFDPTAAVGALDALVRARDHRERFRGTRGRTPPGQAGDQATGRTAAGPAVDHGGGPPAGSASRVGDARALLAAVGIPPDPEAGDHPDAIAMTLGATAAPPGQAVGLRFAGDLGAALDDVAVRPAPLDRREAALLVDDLRGAAALTGVRGQPAVDVAALAGAVEGAAALVAGPAVRDLEVDLVVTPAGVRAVDWTLAPAASATVD